MNRHIRTRLAYYGRSGRLDKTTINGNDMNAAQTLSEKTMPAIATIHEHMRMDIAQDLSPRMDSLVTQIDDMLRRIMDMCEQADNLTT